MTWNEIKWNEMYVYILYKHIFLTVCSGTEKKLPCPRNNEHIITYQFDQKHVFYFPTCQVRVVRFYQSCSSPLPPPPRLAILLLFLVLVLFLLLRLFLLDQLPPQLPPCQLLAKLFANFPAQCAPLDLNLGPSELRGHTNARRYAR